MSKKLPTALAALVIFGLSTPAQSGEHPSKRIAPVKQEVRSAVTVLPGVRLKWSLPTSGAIVDSNILERADVSQSRVVSRETRQVTYYVDFS